jgi:hypothetical protein
LNSFIAADNAGAETPPDDEWPQDPRTLDQARDIAARAEAEDRAGRWRADCPVADRAHAPFIDMLDTVCQSLNCVCILDVDDILVRLGTAHRPGPALHLRGGRTFERPDILAAATSRSHDLLLIVRESGFSVGNRLDGPPIAFFPWPEGVKPCALDDLHISEDGRTIAFVEEGSYAIWLGQATDAAGMIWTRIYPNADMMAWRADDEGEGKEIWRDSMIHCALSPDGRYVAYGSQSTSHYIDRIEGLGRLQRWAEIGPGSEYPHCACFSDDAAVAALNSCHFYHGATLGVRLADIEGATMQAYEDDRRAPLIDDRLRVYAATWLPLGPEKEGFALAGAGYLNIVSPSGDVRSRTYFGSTACSIDFCPRTNRLAVASYSGFLHIYDPLRPAIEGRVIGYRPIHEFYRWVVWKDCPPFRW